MKKIAIIHPLAFALMTGVAERSQVWWPDLLGGVAVVSSRDTWCCYTLPSHWVAVSRSFSVVRQQR
jgi:hypothetical protein